MPSYQGCIAKWTLWYWMIEPTIIHARAGTHAIPSNRHAGPGNIYTSDTMGEQAPPEVPPGRMLLRSAPTFYTYNLISVA